MKPLQTAAVVTILTIAAAWSVPAAAQNRPEPHRGSERSAAQAERRAAPRQAAPRQAPPQRAEPRAVPRTAPRVAPRPVPPHASVVPGARAVPRTYYPGVVRGPQRGRVYAEPRTYGYARPRVVVPVVVYPRPYYVFRPRYFIGFGIYAGLPIPYPLAYGYPEYVYGAPSVVAPPPPNSYGGIALEITPDNAEVAVDGSFVGYAQDFSPMRQPLTLMPGRHHVELQAPGMEPLAFDVDVVPGQVIPFRGSLQPQF
jgi:PEGA domain